MTDDDVLALDATSQADLVRSGAISARSLVEATLLRIEQVEPNVKAFRSVRADDALAAADEIDRRRAPLDDGRPLLGVPVAIKDDTDVADELTAWGSAAITRPAAEDAVVVARLRAAGAIVVGKTNVPELTLWPWTASRRWDTTHNPWNTVVTPGGSSGGSAAAVCSGMSALALGSDGGGSVRYPAGLTGLIGLKPQRGRIPIGPEHGSAWHGLLALGPLTRSVRDAALFLDVVGNDLPPGGYRAVLDERPEPLRIAVSTAPPPGSQADLSSDGRAAVEAIGELLTRLGHAVRHIEIDYGLASLWNGTVRLLKGVQADVAGVPNRRELERRTRRVAALGRLLPPGAALRAERRATAVAASINTVFDDADVVLTPLCGSAAPRIADCPASGALRSLHAANTSAWLVPWNVIGQPAIAVPAGLDPDGMPLAVQLAGRPSDEATLLRLAAQIEVHRPFPQWRA